MKDGIPTAYWVFRYSWSVLHLIILLVLVGALVVWAVTDGQGARALHNWFTWINDVRYSLSDLLPYPWE